jgi:myosin heavy subunit
MADEIGIHEMATSMVWVSTSSLSVDLQKHEWLLAERDGTDDKGRLKVIFNGNALPGVDGTRAKKISEKNTLFVDSSQLDDDQDDVALMNSFSAAPLVHVTRRRFRDGKIHTRVGDIIIVINPYTYVENRAYPNGIDYPIVGGALDKSLRSRFSRDQQPHVYSIAEAALTELFGPANAKSGTRDQSCMVSGESGAGKTEACKRIMKYLAAVVDIERHSADGGATPRTARHSRSIDDLSMEDKILKCNPFLEAFGNAKTTRNDNSSRFGKFVKIQYSGSGAIIGSRIEQYLLEKARLAHQGPNERCFHIFYFMLAGMGASEKKALMLKDVSEYPMLNFGRCTTIDTIDEPQEWAEVQESLNVAGIDASNRKDMWKMLAGILQLSEINWEDKHSTTGDAEATVTNKDISQCATHNLGLASLPTLQGDVSTVCV